MPAVLRYRADMRRLVLVSLMLLAAGCSTVPPPAEPPVVEESSGNARLRHLVGRDLKPMPDKPITVRSRCSHRDAMGTVTRLNLLVRESTVRNFDASVRMKGRGTCNFRLKEFSQEAQAPQVILRHKEDNDCTVRMWTQNHQVTIAFNRCPNACEGSAFDYLWPVVVDARNGRCH